MQGALGHPLDRGVGPPVGKGATVVTVRGGYLAKGKDVLPDRGKVPGGYFVQG